MRYILRRLGFYLVALWASITINFFIPRLIPGDPVSEMLSKSSINVTPAMRQALENLLGIPHASIWVQYVDYWRSLLSGNLGISITHYPDSVTSVIATTLPWTLGLVGLASIISFIIGTFLGILVAWKRESWIDTVATTMLTFISAIPYFWLALIFLLSLGLALGWFPVFGGYDSFNVTIGMTFDFIGSVIRYGTLPALTIVLSSMAGWLLTMRNSMITTLSEDYVLMAQAKGLTGRRVMLAYAARNAILPSITGFALNLGFVVGGSLLTEIVFSYPGLGFQLLAAVQNLDYSLIQGIFLVIAIAVLISNFLADMVIAWLDPRIRQERR